LSVLSHPGLGDAEPLKEESYVDLEEAGDVPELGRRDAVGALLVLLDLLKRQAERSSEVALVIAKTDPFLANPAAYVAVHRMGAVFSLASRHGWSVVVINPNQ
jgi:hypothetical protein